MTLNRMTAIGNLGNDPEMRYTPNGSPVTSFRMAVSRSYNTQDGERREETEWFSVVTWNALAERCNQYLTKGQKVYVDGRLQTRQWEARDGTARTTVEIVAQNVVFMSRPSESGGRGGSGAPGDDAFPEEPSYGGDAPEPDLPF